jgi:hypothetical protein
MAWVSTNLESRGDRVDVRRVATVNLAAVAAASIAGFVLGVSVPATRAVVKTSALPLAQQPANVKIIDAKPRDEKCDGQTWPYLSQDCLSYARNVPDKAPAPVVPLSEPVVSAPVNSEPVVSRTQASPNAASSAPPSSNLDTHAAANARVAVEAVGDSLEQGTVGMISRSTRGRAMARDAAPDSDERAVMLQDDDEAFSARAQAIEPRPRRRAHRHAPFPFPFFR